MLMAFMIYQFIKKLNAVGVVEVVLSKITISPTIHRKPLYTAFCGARVSKTASALGGNGLFNRKLYPLDTV